MHFLVEICRMVSTSIVPQQSAKKHGRHLPRKIQPAAKVVKVNLPDVGSSSSSARKKSGPKTSEGFEFIGVRSSELDCRRSPRRPHFLQNRRGPFSDGRAQFQTVRTRAALFGTPYFREIFGANSRISCKAGDWISFRDSFSESYKISG